MALSDLQSFLQQSLLNFDPSLDITPGSPIDAQVVQPVLRRLGTDPFTVDIGLFIQTTLNQQFPDMATKEGDAITDLLIKAGILLWNPIVREITRVAHGQSFKDPTILTIDEAAALGANLFATPSAGDRSTGVVRIYYAQPQNATVSPANFVTSNAGLHFYPTEVQSIRVEEMLLNLEGSLYYFDIDTIAENAGDQYNLLPDSVVTIANLPSAVRITNKARFRNGTSAETAPDFIGRAEQELTERSMVTERGIVAVLTSQFSDIKQVNSIGFNDPEMQRDLLTGGGLGPVLASGFLMFAESDGESAVATRRVSTTETGVDLTALIGPPGAPVHDYVLTLHGAFPTGLLPTVRDLPIKQVVDFQTVDLVDQVLDYLAVNIPWVLRKKTLSLSGIPGGILFPNQPNGTVVVPNNQIHIGGCTDTYVRGTALDSATLVISDILDDKPVLQGARLSYVDTTHAQLMDLVLGTNYSVNDGTYQVLVNASINGLSVQIFDAPNAGSYRILQVLQVPGSSPILIISPTVTVVPGTVRWAISSSIFLDLAEPKFTKVVGSDLQTTQGSNVVYTLGGTDFATFGVAANDVLRILSGQLILGDYIVQSVLSPAFTKIQVDRPLAGTVSGAQYAIFRSNAEGGLLLPFVRISSIDLLDASNQPIGTKIPYANPIDIESRGFANSAHGIKIDVEDGVLGIVSIPLPLGATVTGQSLTIQWLANPPYFPSPISFTVTFTGSNPVSLVNVVAQINGAVSTATGGLVNRLATLMDNGTRVGLLPVAPNVQVTGGTAMVGLFGYNDKPITSGDVTSVEARGAGGWTALRPTLDSHFDVVQVLDGLQIGFYDGLSVPNTPFTNTQYDPLRTNHDFHPEARRHLQVGSRSLGTARLFFIEPTSFEAGSGALFTVTQLDGSKLQYLPDPTARYQRIPALPSGTKPLDGQTGGILPGNIFQSSSTDFVAQGIQFGDLLVIDFIPLTGVFVLLDPIAGLVGTTLTLSVDGGPDKTVIFVRDSGAIPPNSVTRQGAADQINKTIGQVICSITAGNQLQFNPAVSVVVRAPNPPSQPNTANALLGFSTVVGADQNNDSPDKGTYTIVTAGPPGLTVNQLQITIVFPSGAFAVGQQQFKVFRTGLQRIVSTAMSTQVDTAGLYYFDLTLISQGTGDQYNIGEDIPMVGTGFRSDGYYLTAGDSNLTFSPIEKPQFHVSRSILQVGVSDDPANAIQLSGQNIQINYDRSSLVNDVNNFITSENERVINQSPLARHLIPYFVRFSASYAGGSNTNVTLPDLQTLITNTLPDASLEVSDIEKTLLNRGAVVVDNPIDLIAVIHNPDRSISAERSQNKLNVGRLAAFIPDVLLVTRRTN